MGITSSRVYLSTSRATCDFSLHKATSVCPTLSTIQSIIGVVEIVACHLCTMQQDPECVSLLCWNGDEFGNAILRGLVVARFGVWTSSAELF